MRLAVAAVALITAFSVQVFADAGSTESFTKRFSLIRDNSGKLLFVKENSIKGGFSLKPLVDQIKADLLSEQHRVVQDSYAIIDETYESDITRAAARKFVNQIHNVNVDSLFNNPKFKQVLVKYEALLQKYLMFEPNVMAASADSSFFYKKAVSQKIVISAINYAVKQIDAVPVLGVASYIITAAEQLIRERRFYHQNILMYYLESFKPEDLGMTYDEVQLVTSSIFESRIEWMGYLNHTLARDLWGPFGGMMYNAAYQAADKVLAKWSSSYDKVGERLNYAFQEVTDKGVHKVVNLVDQKHQFSKKPAVAYYYDFPKKVAQKRTIARLIQVAVHFAPLDPASKSFIDDFVESSFAQQRITEGSLVGYLEAHGLKGAKDSVMAQSMNPYIDASF